VCGGIGGFSDFDLILFVGLSLSLSQCDVEKELLACSTRIVREGQLELSLLLEESPHGWHTDGKRIVTLALLHHLALVVNNSWTLGDRLQAYYSSVGTSNAAYFVIRSSGAL